MGRVCLFGRRETRGTTATFTGFRINFLSSERRKENRPERRLRVGLFFVFLGCFVLSRLAHAETAEDLQRVEQKLSEQKEQASQLERKEKETVEELGSLQQKLIESTEALQQKQAEQDDLKDKLRQLENEIDRREKSLSGAQSQLGSFAEVLLRFNRQPAEAFLMRDPLADDNWHRALLLGSLLPRLENRTAELLKELEDLEALRQSAAEQKRLVASARQNLAWQRSNFDQLIKTRQGFLQKTTAEKEALAKELAALADEAKDLRQLMEKVTHSAVLPKSATKPPPLSNELKTPVNGKVLRGYGAKDEFGVTSQGLTLRASASSLVIAPADGRVAFAGLFKGYGHIVILQHGGGYHSFLAGFGRIDTEVGQNVAAGEPLGALPDQGDSPAELYFEWRHNGEPIDPSKWTPSRK